MDVQSATTSSSSRDEFLQLLVTQLRHQDPLEPVKQEDFLAQLAQFSTLEGIEKMNASVASQIAIQTDLLKLQQFSQAATMIGRQVGFQSADGTNRVGRVDSVSVADGVTKLKVGNESIFLDQVTTVLADREVLPSTNEATEAGTETTNDNEAADTTAEPKTTEPLAREGSSLRMPRSRRATALPKDELMAALELLQQSTALPSL